MNDKITPDKVAQAVKDFWKAFAGRSARALAEFYSADASIFGIEGTRSELVRLASARREREYFNRHAKVTIHTDFVDVRLLCDTAAVATYSFHFHAANVGAASGKTLERSIPHGRATQIFELTTEGTLVIVHEHLSSADIRKESEAKQESAGA